ncbi:YdcF family protein [uncultured Thiodictyon sp.]|uniref:YdcF family protein n=1 Tax=uncultured Thiodictyon sp. TaxID=1846217 RepID=UPI0026011232|nr:YdcF family protein [uncultured Thiodictyon sp.]
MTAQQIIKTLLLPPGIIILMLVGAFFLVRGGAGRALLLTATAGFTLLCLPVVAILLMVPLEPYAALDLRAPLAPQVKGILVLGGGLRSDAPEFGGLTLDTFTLQRVRYGAKLQRATGLPLYVSGGVATAQAPAVGELMARTLREEFAVPVAGVENRSRTTWENAAYSKPMLERDGVAQVLLVSDAWHLPRAVAACEQAGFAVTPAPTGLIAGPHWREQLGLSDWVPRAGALAISTYALQEHLGRVWYQLRRWAQDAPVHPVEPPGAPGTGVSRRDAP